jgi:6,7-dimethyl-8-ribityllumazine synthase
MNVLFGILTVETAEREIQAQYMGEKAKHSGHTWGL